MQPSDLARSPEKDRVRLCGASLALLGLVGCAGAPADPTIWEANLRAFQTELADLGHRLDVPGLAYAVVSDGEVLESRAIGTIAADSDEPFTTATPLRFASVTKSLTAVIVMQLVQEGLLDLEASVRSYVPDADLPEEVRVRHLLTHTSEGIVGQEYVYGTTRYALLGRVIESVSDGTYAAALRKRIIYPTDMGWYDSPGLGANAGLVSTIDDMARYIQALDRGDLLKNSSSTRLATPSRSRDGRPLPLSLGWFAQTVQGTPVTWSYGQDDPEHSGALLFRVPKRRLTLVLLANRNTVSDPFRLLMGDVRRSPIAMAFYRLLVASPPGEPLPRPPWGHPDLGEELRQREAETGYRYEDEVIGEALVRLWNDRQREAAALFELAVEQYDLASRPDPVVHFAALRLPGGPWKQMGVVMGEKLLAEHPDNRWMLLAQGYLRQQTGSEVSAAALFERILDLPNQEEDFLHRLFGAWSRFALAEIHADDDPELARTHLDAIVESGVQGGLLDDARAKLRELGDS